jgi:hypothetical protein
MQPLDITTYLLIVCFSQLCIADERGRQLHDFPEQTWRSPKLFNFAELEDRSPVPFGLCILWFVYFTNIDPTASTGQAITGSGWSFEPNTLRRY